MEMEADRFQRLKYTPGVTRPKPARCAASTTRTAPSPFTKLYEMLRETAFKKHTYSHTTMGYIKDIEDMPNQYDYSWQFFNRYYRPEYTTIVLVGDVTARATRWRWSKKYFGDWKRGDYVPQIPLEPEQKEPRTSPCRLAFADSALSRRGVSRPGLFG